MRIYSNFKDYYDIGLAYHDDSVVYERYTKEIEERIEVPSELKNPVLYSWKEESYDREIHIYVVCGEVFYVLRYARKVGHPTENFIFTSFDDFQEYVEERSSWFISLHERRGPNIIEFINTLKQFQFKHKTPIVCAKIQKWEKNKIEINSRLSEVEFQKVIDPYQMYQKIETFLANDLAQELNPPVKIEDKYKIQAHGFDKWSFRKKGKNGSR